MKPRTLTAVPAKAAGHVCSLDGALLTGLQKHKQPLELVRDTGDWILLQLLNLPTGAETLKTVGDQNSDLTIFASTIAGTLLYADVLLKSISYKLVYH